MSRSPTLSEVLNRVRDAASADVRVALPAKVVRWDAAKQQIDAQPLVKAAYTDEEGDRQTEKLPVVPCVPVVFPGGGGFAFTFPLSVGDTVLLVFADASIDKWLSVGGVVDPQDDRRHDITDAIAIPGLRPFSNPLSSAPGSSVKIGQDGGTYSGVAMGDATYATFMAALKTHTHPTVGASPELAALTVPGASATVKVTP